jgi:FkbM family methyltransferase
MKTLKKMVRPLIPRKLRDAIRGGSEHRHPSYAQEGEDRILCSLLGFPARRTPGFYIDVGAHHPQRFSNTYFFYTQGWSGLNIDAMPGSMAPFRRERPRDTNLEAAVASREGSLTFYEFNEPALNGFSREVAQSRDKHKGWRIIGERKLPTTRLDTLLDRALAPAQVIDFLSIDVEGLDFDVLSSGNWTKYRPAVVLVEDGEAMAGPTGQPSAIQRFMAGNRYRSCCRTLLTSFFVDEDQVVATPMGLRLKLAHAPELAGGH